MGLKIVAQILGIYQVANNLDLKLVPNFFSISLQVWFPSQYLSPLLFGVAPHAPPQACPEAHEGEEPASCQAGAM